MVSFGEITRDDVERHQAFRYDSAQNALEAGCIAYTMLHQVGDVFVPRERLPQYSRLSAGLYKQRKEHVQGDWYDAQGYLKRADGFAIFIFKNGIDTSYTKLPDWKPQHRFHNLITRMLG